MLLIIIAVIAVIMVYAIKSYNLFVQYRNQANNASSSVDVMLKKRFDLIPEVLEACKGYANYEKETLQRITQLRTQTLSTMSHSEKDDAANFAGEVTRRTLATVEAYPELKASHHFMHLQRTITEAEEQLSAARRFHNGAVTAFNNLCQSFPTNIIASICGFRKMELFQFK